MPRSYEEATQTALELHTAQEAVQWSIGQLALEQAEAWGITPQQMASDWGYSASAIRKMMRTVRAFPNPADRVALLSFSHHALAAQTDDPMGWLTQAEANSWSIRDLQEAIAQAKAANPQEARKTAGERALQRLRKWWEQATIAERQALFPAIQQWYVVALTTQKEGTEEV